MVALASLGGVPLTLGGNLRWSFLQLCWLRGWIGAMPPLALVYGLLSMPAWLRVRQAWLPTGRQTSAPRWRLWAATGAAYAAATTLLLLGFFPGWLVRGALHLFDQHPETQLVTTTSAFARGLILLLMTYAVPIMGSVSLHRLSQPVLRGLATWFERLNALLDWDWLYAVIEAAAARLQRLGDSVLAAVEGSFYLVWTVLCSLALVYYLLGK
jgi:hypothetical protein